MDSRPDRPGPTSSWPSRWRRWRWTLLLAVACSAILLGSALAWYAPRTGSTGLPPPSGPPPISTDQITDADLIFSYTTNNPGDAHYLTPPPECDECPFLAAPGSTWLWSFNLTNSDSLNHNITGIIVDAPFVLASESPLLPLVLNAGSTVTIVLTITIPNAPGYYDLQGSVDTD